MINLLSWALVGYSEIHTYLHLSSEVTDALWRGGYSMLAVARHLGLGRAGGEALLLAASALVAALTIYVGAIRRRELDALVLAVVLMLVASPLLWSHYFSLLLVPVALRRPRLGLVWALPLLMWPMPPRQPVYGWEEFLAWGVTAVCVALVLRERPVGRRLADRRPYQQRPAEALIGDSASTLPAGAPGIEC